MLVCKWLRLLFTHVLRLLLVGLALSSVSASYVEGRPSPAGWWLLSCCSGVVEGVGDVAGGVSSGDVFVEDVGDGCCSGVVEGVEDVAGGVSSGDVFVEDAGGGCCCVDVLFFLCLCVLYLFAIDLCIPSSLIQAFPFISATLNWLVISSLCSLLVLMLDLAAPAS